MIRDLRKKFILIAMLSLIITLVFIVCIINLLNIRSVRQRADSLMDYVYEIDGRFPDMDARGYHPRSFQITAETPFESRFFIVHLDGENNVESIDMKNIAALDEDTAMVYLEQILDGGRTSGTMDQYRYRLYNSEEGTTIVVLDMFLQIQSIVAVLQITLVTVVACIVIVFLLLLMLSRYAIRPFVKNMEKQRQFITDASHELKTPITIISANTDVMELLQGETEWTASTKKQVVRLNRLVRSLVELAKMEEDKENIELEALNLSDIAGEVADSFEAVALSQGKTLTADIEPGIMLHGSGDSLYRLVQILFDNAVKYSADHSDIALSVTRRGRTATLKLSNTAVAPLPQDVALVFERFYRSDKSRNEGAQGHGIGLSVAQAIVQRHRGRIAVETGGDMVSFVVQLPL